MNQLPEQEVMQRWWKFMGDIMKTNSDGSPRVQPLKQVFYIN
jgi:L-rhamnose mutarotase